MKSTEEKEAILNDYIVNLTASDEVTEKYNVGLCSIRAWAKNKGIILPTAHQINPYHECKMKEANENLQMHEFDIKKEDWYKDIFIFLRETCPQKISIELALSRTY